MRWWWAYSRERFDSERDQWGTHMNAERAVVVRIHMK